MAFSMHYPRRQQMTREGFEVAQIRVCKETREVVVVAYRYTGVDEAPPLVDAPPLAASSKR